MLGYETILPSRATDLGQTLALTGGWHFPEICQELQFQCLISENQDAAPLGHGVLFCNNSKHSSIFTMNKTPFLPYLVYKCFKKRPLTGPANSSPSKFCRTNVLLSRLLTILKGPSHRWSNFPCLGFSSLIASHLSTKSLGKKLFSLTFFY